MITQPNPGPRLAWSPCIPKEWLKLKEIVHTPPDVSLLLGEAGQELVGGDLAGHRAKVPRIHTLSATRCKEERNFA